MSGRALPAELAAVRALVADGLAEMGEVGDAGQVWIRSASARLTALDGVLTEAAGVLAAPVQVAAVTMATFLVVAGSAALAGALGFSGGGVLAFTGAAVLIMFAALPYAGRRVFGLVGRRRLARSAAVPAHRSARPAPPGPAIVRHPEAALAQASDRLLRARVRLVSAALRRAGADDWTTPGLRRAIRTDPVIRRLAHADQLLCQAVDCLERHLGDQRKDAV
ncbi:hypothetical protein Ait01nite_000820 [Actinoplanes italicus]|uniref:Uncharacterized protein n=1 Tax=Actinoplanes italicus TaxID=113567 RepID=A0A2T0KDH9_9ACTN|nr:hypothetical protein [Actinoplanes italicus]PRX21358.1 hypothetical protein CLV67_106138 [Actinoplanes italicus]GIE27037.1 hypothetical protein Ait01nite_000820 [Actinoplanes italicus]